MSRSPSKVLSRQVSKASRHYEDTTGKKFGQLQGFIIIPDGNLIETVRAAAKKIPTAAWPNVLDATLAIRHTASSVRRKPTSNGCQSPCGNLWLAAIALLFEDRNTTVKHLINTSKEKAPGNDFIRHPNKSNTTVKNLINKSKAPVNNSNRHPNKFETKVFLSESAARAMARAFIKESDGLDELKQKIPWLSLEDYIVKGLRGDNCVWITYCMFEAIPERVLDWLYVLEIDQSSGEEAVQQRDINNRILQTNMLKLTVKSLSPGKITLIDGSEQVTIASVSAYSPNGGKNGKLICTPPSYEKVLGLVHVVTVSDSNEVWEGATVFGSRTAWLYTENPVVVYVTDGEETGRWYRLRIKQEHKSPFVPAGTNSEILRNHTARLPPRTSTQQLYHSLLENPEDGNSHCTAIVCGNHEEAFSRVVTGSPNSESMALLFPKCKTLRDGTYRASRDKLSGVYLLGRKINSKHVLIGYNTHQNDGGVQRQRIVVSDPSAIPLPTSKQFYRRHAPWNTLPLLSWIFLVLGSMAMWITFSCVILLRKDHFQKPIDIFSRDGMFYLSIFRLVTEFKMRAVILCLSIHHRSTSNRDALLGFFCIRAIDATVMGVPWPRRRISRNSFSFWWRRTLLRTRAFLSVLAIIVSVHQMVAVEHRDDRYVVVILGLILGPAFLITSSDSMIPFLEELSGARLGTKAMIGYLSHCVVADILSTILASSRSPFFVEKDLDDHTYWKECAFLAVSLAESILYSLVLLSCMSALRIGLEQEKSAVDELASETSVRFMTLSERVEQEGTEWGLGGVANRPDVRGILTLFEGNGNDGDWTRVQASSPWVKISDWVVATQAGGFQLYPILHTDGIIYEGRDFKTEDSTTAGFLTLSDDYHPSSRSIYSNVKLLYVDMDIPWTGSKSQVCEIPGVGKCGLQKITHRPSLSDNAVKATIDHHRLPRQAAIMLDDEVFVALGPPL